jgi:phosphatidylglycerol:prolipoprotein diacylglycerol transferase
MGDKLPGKAYGLWEAVFSGGGLVFYGGFLAGFGGLYLYLRKNSLNVWDYGDAFIPSMALGYAIGRLGCMVSGDGCYGYAASIDIPLLTMVYGPMSVISSHGVNVWNTPMMESIASAALFAWMMMRGRFMNFRPGMLIALFFVVNGLIRFLVEFLRLNDAAIPILDPPMIEITAGNFAPLSFETAIQAGAGGAYYFKNWHWYGFTQSQIVGVFLVISGLVWIFARRLYRAKEA